jgi:hypothetical protein
VLTIERETTAFILGSRVAFLIFPRWIGMSKLFRERQNFNTKYLITTITVAITSIMIKITQK